MASNKNDKPRRRYELRARARQREATRRRITEAAVELHGTVGPAHTTISDVAKLAGVRRMTVYNHFATDADLFDACSTHWITRNPPPDVTRWTRIEEPLERVGQALRDMYAYYAQHEQMLGNVLRDTMLIPALGTIMDQKWWPAIEGMVEVLFQGFESEGRSNVARRAALRLALDFSTWRTLTRSNLEGENAARLMQRFVSTVEGADI